MLWIIVPILVIAIDRISKYIIVENMAEGQSIPVIEGFFYLALHKNPGAAWGILKESKMLFLILIPLISAAVIYYMLKNRNRFLRFSLLLILGGAIGNYIDRLLEGAVTDFLLFYIGSYPFPIFNAADIAITCGTFLLAVYMLFIYKEPARVKRDLSAGKDAAIDGSAEMAEGILNDKCEDGSQSGEFDRNDANNKGETKDAD